MCKRLKKKMILSQDTNEEIDYAAVHFEEIIENYFDGISLIGPNITVLSNMKIYE